MISIALGQTRPEFLDVRANLESALAMIDSVQADVYVFPELFLSGYAFSTGFELEGCALSSTDPVWDRFLELSSDRGIAVCGGYAERSGDKFYNSAFLIGDGGWLLNYRKTHLYFRECDFFEPGDTGFLVADFHGVRLGVMICFDWFFPESARTLALRGAQVILHPANLVMPYCQRAMFARAVENRVFAATCNRVGRERNTHGDDLTFTGQSQVVSTTGDYLLTFGSDETAIRSVEIDPEAADAKVLNRFNTILADRRPEMYE